MTKRFALDLLERSIATYVEVFVGLLLVSWADVTSAADVLDVGTSAALAAVPAALAVVKAGAARLRGDREDASLVQPPISSRT